VKIIQITDTHLLGADRANVYGLNAAYRLKRAIKSVNAYHSDAAFIVLTGDLADVASEAAYDLLKRILKKSKLPVYPIVGNHDIRAQFGKHFAYVNGDGFVQYVQEKEGKVFLFLDTLVEGERYGKMCTKRLKWLEEKLEKYKKRPVYLFMHHHPVDSGLYEMDHYANFRSGKPFWKLIDRYGNVKHITFGHLHRIMQISRKSVSMHTTRSTTFQVSYQPQEELEYLTNKEKPTYAVMEILKGDLLRIHQHEYLDEKRYYEDGTRFQG
jgi:3',5'-cyclic AMP phosphodiesterase CpdA